MGFLIDWDQTREMPFIFPWKKKKKTFDMHKKKTFDMPLRHQRNYIYNYLSHPWYLFFIDNHKNYNKQGNKQSNKE